MLKPALTEHIANTFRPILIDLCARWLQFPENTEEKFEAFGLLIQIHEELFQYVPSINYTYAIRT
jgi:midasin